MGFFPRCSLRPPTARSIRANVEGGADGWREPLAGFVRDIRLPLLSPTILLVDHDGHPVRGAVELRLFNAADRRRAVRSTTNVYYVMWEYGFKTIGPPAGARLRGMLVLRTCSGSLRWSAWPLCGGLPSMTK